MIFEFLFWPLEIFKLLNSLLINAGLEVRIPFAINGVWAFEKFE